MLFQITEGQERVVAYAATALRAADKNYVTIEEALQWQLSGQFEYSGFIGMVTSLR